MSSSNLGRIFNQALQSSLDRQQQRKAQRRAHQVQLKRIAERARRFNQRQQQSQNQFEERQGLRRDRLGLKKRRQRNRELQSFWDMRQALKADPGTIEVQRQNVEALPGEGSARVNPNVLIRRHSSDSASGSSSSGDESSTTAAAEGFEAKKVRSGDSFRVWEMMDGEPVGQHGGLTEPEADSLVTELNKRDAPTDTTDVPTDTTGPTSSTDSTTTRGLGGRPDGTFVPAGQLGMTTGGVGGGGANEPQPSIMALRAQAMGAADMGQVDDSTLVDRAFNVAVQRSPQEARQRLDGLVQQGQLDPAQRDSIMLDVEQRRQALRDRLQGLRGGQ